MMRASAPPTGERDDRPQKPGPARYFLPGQFILHLTHPVEIDSTNVAEQTIQFLKKQAGDDWIRQIELPKPGSIITLRPRGGKGSAFSIIPTRLPVQRARDVDLLTLQRDLNSRVRDKPMNIDPAGNILLQAGSPNWLAGGANDQSGTGGPGSWPVEADAQAGKGWRFYQLDKDNQRSALPSSPARESNVHVAILDTAPTRHALRTAYLEWSWHHELICSLLRPGGPLRLYPASCEELQQTKDYDLLAHRYIMRDHGLFIAGIIHSIAPEAMLHLYEVLNPYGVGSLETIARGLSKALDFPDLQDPHNPLIINCSFMFGIPVKGGFDPDFPSPLDTRDDGLLEEMKFSVQGLFDWITGQTKVTVVAAAGNDAHYNNSNAAGDRPDTRYPAAFQNVWGVGALPIVSASPAGQYRAATYSNVSDKPSSGSYITLGGEPGIKNGVLGVYIGDFPRYDEPLSWKAFLWRLFHPLHKRFPPGLLPLYPRAVMPEHIRYQRNTTGWAWWAGTSFATPVVSGILAANDADVAVLGGIHDLLAGASNVSPVAETPEHEKVILVTQAPP